MERPLTGDQGENHPLQLHHEPNLLWQGQVGMEGMHLSLPSPESLQELLGRTGPVRDRPLRS